MGKITNIEWTDHTFNPWWGCIRVSPGCEHCYAESQAKRFGWDVWGPQSTTPRRFFGNAHWNEPFRWNADARAAGVRRRVFCASFADVFESTENPLQIRARRRLFDVIYATSNLDWLLLTKRPENIASMLPDCHWSNVWLGTSTENQAYADKRIPLLLQHRDRVPVLFVSAEPLLGPLLLREYMEGYAIDWVITGGESGPRHRPFQIGWVRDINEQCRAAGVAHFFKQHGGRTHAAGGCDLDGVEVKEFPVPRLPVAA